jgi:hypothetical protein
MLQASLALDLFVRVVVRGDLREPSLTTLAINLWNLAHRHGHIDQKLSVSISILAFSSIFNHPVLFFFPTLKMHAPSVCARIV